MKKITLLITALLFLTITACKSTEHASEADQITAPAPTVEVETPQPAEEPAVPETIPEPEPVPQTSDTITLLFGGDIMAHTVNYNVSEYAKIWRDVKDEILPADLAFGNIEAPIDTTRPASSWPNFNMTKKYVEAAVDAGFDVFSLCNNHTNDQGLNGIKETMKTTKLITERSAQRNEQIYFSGLKNGADAQFSYNLIEKNGWKILFIPITELLNRPDHSDYINFVKPKEKERQAFIEHCKKLREANPCDLFIVSVHTAEPEYTRKITEAQDKYYKDLLAAGVDVVWANHAHIIKDRKIFINSETQAGKLIMYANGNVISGQRTAPELTSKNPTGERDNTGDGLLYQVTLKKTDLPQSEKSGILSTVQILSCKPLFITTYINTANEFVLKKLDQSFVEYLYDVPRTNWAKYIEKRIKINQDYTKDYIEWQ